MGKLRHNSKKKKRYHDSEEEKRKYQNKKKKKDNKNNADRTKTRYEERGSFDDDSESEYAKDLVEHYKSFKKKNRNTTIDIADDSYNESFNDYKQHNRNHGDSNEKKFSCLKKYILCYLIVLSIIIILGAIYQKQILEFFETNVLHLKTEEAVKTKETAKTGKAEQTEETNAKTETSPPTNTTATEASSAVTGTTTQVPASQNKTSSIAVKAESIQNKTGKFFFYQYITKRKHRLLAESTHVIRNLKKTTAPTSADLKKLSDDTLQNEINTKKIEEEEEIRPPAPIPLFEPKNISFDPNEKSNYYCGMPPRYVIEQLILNFFNEQIKENKIFYFSTSISLNTEALESQIPEDAKLGKLFTPFSMKVNHSLPDLSQHQNTATLSPEQTKIYSEMVDTLGPSIVSNALSGNKASDLAKVIDFSSDGSLFKGFFGAFPSTSALLNQLIPDSIRQMVSRLPGLSYFGINDETNEPVSWKKYLLYGFNDKNDFLFDQNVLLLQDEVKW